MRAEDLRRGLGRLIEALPRPAARAGAPFLSAWALDGEVFDERTINRAYDDFCDLHLWLALRGAGDRSARVSLWLHSERARPAELRLGNTGPVTVILDGTPLAQLTRRAARRDGHTVALDLPSGWARLELALESDGPPWGFYARVTDKRGDELDGLTVSLSGPGRLVVDTAALPIGFVSWPYVELANRRPEPRAAPLRLIAGGGRPPYRWSSDGLPPGLKLSGRGELTGVPRVAGTSRLIVQATDADGQGATRELDLEVAEPPTAWYEDAALGAFVSFDKPESVEPARWDDELEDFASHARRWAKLAAEAGASVLVLTGKHHDSWANWPTAVSRSDGTPAKRTSVDTLGAARDACEAAGIRFGVYYSLVDTWHPGYRADMPDYLRFQYLQMEELLDLYEPSVVWLDGHWDQPGAEWEYDSLISLVHGRAPECVVANNPGRRTLDVSEFGRGDVDVRTSEAHSPGERMTRRRGRSPNPRPLPAEKVAFTCDWWSPGGAPETAGCTRNRDPREWLRALSEVVCAGGTLQIGLGPGYPGAPAGAPEPGELHAGAREVLTGVGAWLSAGRAEAFENVRQGPLRPGRWGASVHSGDTIWLHVRRHGRLRLRGLPDGRSVTRATLLGDGSELAVRDEAGSLEIDLRRIRPDPAVTLIRIDTRAQA